MLAIDAVVRKDNSEYGRKGLVNLLIFNPDLAATGLRDTLSKNHKASRDRHSPLPSSVLSTRRVLVIPSAVAFIHLLIDAPTFQLLGFDTMRLSVSRHASEQVPE